MKENLNTKMRTKLFFFYYVNEKGENVIFPCKFNLKIIIYSNK